MLALKKIELGSIVDVSMLGNAQQARVCPCCQDVMGRHKTAVCVWAADQGAQNHKALVGVGCKPPVSKVEGEYLTLKWSIRHADQPQFTKGNVMYATRNYARREVSVHANTVTVKLWLPEGKGAQQIAKLPASLKLDPANIKMQLPGTSEWVTYDSAIVTKEMGKTGKYQGFKAYNR